MSLGVDSENNIELQVVSLPVRKQLLPHSLTQYGNKNNHEDSEEGEFILAGSIPILPDTPHVQFDALDDFAWIFHQYTGRTVNRIRLWIRDNFVGSFYSIFNIPVDFRKAPGEWFTDSRLTSWKECSGRNQAPQYDIEHKRLTEKYDMPQFIIPGMCGKRFFWWRETHPLENVGSQTDSQREMVIEFYSSDTDCLPPVIQQEPKERRGHEKVLTVEEEEAKIESNARRFEECMSYPVKALECPFRCQYPEERWDEDDEEGVYVLLTEGYSGTIFFVLTCGDVLVLRYGHP